VLAVVPTQIPLHRTWMPCIVIESCISRWGRPIQRNCVRWPRAGVCQEEKKTCFAQDDGQYILGMNCNERNGRSRQALRSVSVGGAETVDSSGLFVHWSVACWLYWHHETPFTTYRHPNIPEPSCADPGILSGPICKRASSESSWRGHPAGTGGRRRFKQVRALCTQPGDGQFGLAVHCTGHIQRCVRRLLDKVKSRDMHCRQCSQTSALWSNPLKPQKAHGGCVAQCTRVMGSHLCPLCVDYIAAFRCGVLRYTRCGA